MKSKTFTNKIKINNKRLSVHHISGRSMPYCLGNHEKRLRKNRAGERLSYLGSWRSISTTASWSMPLAPGVLHHQKPITIDAFPLHFGRQIIKSHSSDTKPDVDIPRYIELYRHSKLKLDEQITHRYCLDEINEAVYMVRKGLARKCVILMP